MLVDPSLFLFYTRDLLCKCSVLIQCSFAGQKLQSSITLIGNAHSLLLKHQKVSTEPELVLLKPFRAIGCKLQMKRLNRFEMSQRLRTKHLPQALIQ